MRAHARRGNGQGVAALPRMGGTAAMNDGLHRLTLKQINENPTLMSDEVFVLAEEVDALLQEMNNLRKESVEHEHSFEIRWNADMRAIKKWHEAGGDPMTWPDHADLCVWLMGQRNEALNHATRLRAQAEGFASQLLDVQADCIELRRKLAERETP